MATEPHQYVLRDLKTDELLREATDEEVAEWRRGATEDCIEVDGRLCFVEG